LTKNDDPNIAVILAEGEISTDGDGLSSKEICKLFQDVRKNSSIKTVVFRVNSPGGSALASDEIWREVVLTNKSKKVIISMGDVAASGGYYIAAPGTTIFAEPTTITGSIGVFGMIPYLGKMLENKLGITFDRAGTNTHSVMSLMKKMTPEELKMIQEEVDYTYMEFLNRVAVGRNLSVDQVNIIARGRVWTGRDALEIGLVDRLGGLNDAIQFASKKAGITDKKVLYYPLKEEDIWQEFLEDFEEENGGMVKATQKLPEALTASYESLVRMSNRFGIQMRLPYEITIH
jgi:protease-4